MLTTRLLRELRIDPATHPHGAAWLSAASGLVCVGEYAYVIADDQHHLGQFAMAASTDTDAAARPVELVQLFDGALPRDEQKRKKAKPDLESLALLPALPLYPHGALVTLGSGSKPNRCRGRLLPLDAQQRLTGGVVPLDLSAWYRTLQEHCDDLNIEGAFVADGVLRLIQRGNKGDSPSACLLFAWDEVSAWLEQPSRHAPRLDTLVSLDFGMFDGVPVCPTDGAALPDGSWVFSAVAEDTEDSYQDGACLASFVGVLDANNQLSSLRRLQDNPKVEGIAVVSKPSRGSFELLLVTDPDDPAQPARLLQLSMT
jgi:hypothetical protein